MTRAIFNWSWGKDSAIALWTARQDPDLDIRYVLTTVNQTHSRVSMHGVREALLDQQAERLRVPLRKVYLPEQAPMELYNQRMQEALSGLSLEGIHTSIYGDIFLQDLREYREKELTSIGWKALFPIWGRPTAELLAEVIRQGFKAVIVCVNKRYLDSSWIGRELDESFLEDLPPGVDPCGENGEYHSFVYDGPNFSAPVPFSRGETVYRTYQTGADQTIAGPSGQTGSGSGDQTSSGPADIGFYFGDLIPLDE